MNDANSLPFPAESTTRSSPTVSKYRVIGSVQSTWLGRLLVVSCNLLTLARALLSPLVYIFAIQGWMGLAFGVYVFGLLTDVMDGPLARTFQVSSPFGRAMDSAADKMLVFSGLAGLHGVNQLPLWLLLVFVLREFFMFGLRAIRTDTGATVGEIFDTLGRVRFFVLHVGILLLLVPSTSVSKTLTSFGFEIVAVALFIGWVALAFYIKRDFATIRTTFRKAQTDPSL